jgi:calcium/proton exchanger cax
VEATATLLHVPAFLGVIVLTLVGTSADRVAAVAVAVAAMRRDGMNMVFSICIGSAMPVALVAASVLALACWRPGLLALHEPCSWFSRPVRGHGAVFIVCAIAAGGQTNWFESLRLVGVYVLLVLHSSSWRRPGSRQKMPVTA